jgi:thiol-disulfide isomerase/thioredoxin
MLILVAVIGCTSQGQPSDVPSIDDFTAQRLDEYRGQVVVLNFWAVWCKPCRVEMPDLEAVYQEYREQGAVVLAVNVSESSADIADFAEELGLTFPIFRDSKQEAMREYNVKILPTTFFIDRKGLVRHSRVGTMTKSVMTKQIEALLE